MATVLTGSIQLTSERWFYLGIAGTMLVLIILGFGPSYYFTPLTARPPMLPMTPLVHLHGLIFTLWTLLFIWQTSLVSAGRLVPHRKAAPIALVLLAGMILSGGLAGLQGVGRASGPPDILPLSWLAVTLVPIPFFTGLILAALYFRRTPQTHKRLILLAMFTMLPPAIGRIFPGPPGMVVGPALFVLALLAWDLVSSRRIHPATAIGGPLVLVSLTLPMMIWDSAAWLSFAGWASGLMN
jgi:hypothetical protein